LSNGLRVGRRRRFNTPVGERQDSRGEDFDAREKANQRFEAKADESQHGQEL
jgi:hypothetical protein